MTRLGAMLLLVVATSVVAAPPKKRPPAAKPAPAEPPPPARAETPLPEPGAPEAPAPAPSAAPAPPAPEPAPPAVATTEKPRLVVLDLTTAGGVDRETAQSLTEVIAAQAARTGIFQVTSQKDVATLLSLERQKQLLGCSEEASACVSELAGALGARFVLSGSLARLGADTYQLNLQTQDTASTRTVGRATRIANDLKTLRATVPWAFAEATATPAPPQPSRALPITLMSSGGAALVGSGVLFILSLQREDAAVRELALSAEQPQVQIKDAAFYRAEADAVRTQRIIGGVLAGVGAAALATGIFLLPSAEVGSAQVALTPTPSGAAVVGVFP